MTRHSKFHVKRAEQTAAVISKMMAKDMFPISIAKHKSSQSTTKCVMSEFTVPIGCSLYDDNATKLCSWLVCVHGLITDS